MNRPKLTSNNIGLALVSNFLYQYHIKIKLSGVLPLDIDGSHGNKKCMK